MNGKSMVLLLAEILLHKEIIQYSEYDAILDMRNNDDLFNFIERMWNDEFKGYVKGDSEFGGIADRETSDVSA